MNAPGQRAARPSLGADILPDHTVDADGADTAALDAAAGGADPRNLAVLGEADDEPIEDEDADPVGGGKRSQR